MPSLCLQAHIVDPTSNLMIDDTAGEILIIIRPQERKLSFPFGLVTVAHTSSHLLSRHQRD
jgi:hypothetical protein